MVYFNGSYIDATTGIVDVQNRAFKYGDAVFESCLYTNGQAPLLSYNLARLFRGCAILQMEIPPFWQVDFFKAILHELAVHHGLQTGRIKITVWRSGAGLYRPQKHTADLLIEIFPLDQPPFTMAARNYVVDVYREYPKIIHPVSACKTANALPYVLAALYAEKNALDDVFLMNTESTLADAISSNIWLLNGHTLTTTPELNGGVRGTMQEWLCDHASDLGFNLQRKPIEPEEPLDAEAIFVTNAIQGLIPVTQYRQHSFENKKPIQLLSDIRSLLFD